MRKPFSSVADQMNKKKILQLSKSLATELTIEKELKDTSQLLGEFMDREVDGNNAAALILILPISFSYYLRFCIKDYFIVLYLYRTFGSGSFVGWSLWSA